MSACEKSVRGVFDVRLVCAREPHDDNLHRTVDGTEWSELPCVQHKADVEARCSTCGELVRTAGSMWTHVGFKDGELPEHMRHPVALASPPTRRGTCKVCWAPIGSPHNAAVHDEYDNARMGIG